MWSPETEIGTRAKSRKGRERPHLTDRFAALVPSGFGGRSRPFSIALKAFARVPRIVRKQSSKGDQRCPLSRSQPSHPKSSRSKSRLSNPFSTHSTAMQNLSGRVESTSSRPLSGSSSRRITTSSVGSVHKTHLTPKRRLAQRRSHDSTHPQLEGLHCVRPRFGNRDDSLLPVAVPRGEPLLETDLSQSS